MILQQTFADVVAPREKVNWASYAVTCSDNERGIIQAIMDLHNGGKPFDLDPTYSRGVFWKDLPQPRIKFDLFADKRGMAQANAAALPLATGSVDSIMFDPPFVVAPSPAPGEIRDRFTCMKDVATLWRFYSDALAECYRVLRPDGMMAFKCQDIVNASTQHLSHVHAITEAQRIGFYVKDLFVLWRANVLWSPNMVKQYHARKNHCYFLVMVKED